MKRIAWIFAFVSFFGAQGCENGDVLPADKPGDQPGQVADSSAFTLFDGEWILVNYKNARLSPDLQNKVILKFENGSGTEHRLSGTSFVNGYSGYFTLDEQHALITYSHDLISTFMGGTDEQNAAERKYFQHLMSVKSYGLSGQHLTLYFGSQEMGYFVRKK